jgi:predicted transcriptional regulator
VNSDAAAGQSNRRAHGALEAKILSVLQIAGRELTTAQVIERLDDDLAYTTVVTILSRLHTKGLLTRVQRGRAHAYAPVADESGLAARQMRQVLEASPDRQAVLTSFVDDLSTSDEALLRRLLAADLDSGQGEST